MLGDAVLSSDGCWKNSTVGHASMGSPGAFLKRMELREGIERRELNEVNWSQISDFGSWLGIRDGDVGAAAPQRSVRLLNTKQAQRPQHRILEPQQIARH